MSSNDTEISPEELMLQCLNLERLKSFFLFAGAGSGKTRALVEVLKAFKQTDDAPKLRLAGQQVAIITYTNAACDEIQRRLDYDPTFIVSTIHSFAWELIRPYVDDIRSSIRQILQKDIEKLTLEQQKGRTGSKTAVDREQKIESKTRRLESIKEVRKFTYNPNGDNTDRDSLNHSEVIQLAAEFLLQKPLMQQIMIQAYPILLIDESQDTKKALINAFFKVERQHAGKFCLGLFGDTMQRIYMDGEESLGKNIPADWEKPCKPINHRCPTRVTRIINKVCENIEGSHQQTSPEGKEEGHIRLFVVKNNAELDKTSIERQVNDRMAEITQDEDWRMSANVKTLCLEHKMAARRGGFINFFSALASEKSFYTGLLDGSLRGIPLLTKLILPLVTAHQANDKFEISRLCRKKSPFLKPESLKDSPSEQIAKVRDAVEELLSLWDSATPTLLEIIRIVHRRNLFPLAGELSIIASRTNEAGIPSKEGDPPDSKIKAWEQALQSNYTELVAYSEYISDNSQFGTHQGIKGLEFPRVVVILDDQEAAGCSWSYEKLFGVKAPTSSDIKNAKEGKETSIDRTRRLFYVTCSRAQKSLAVIAYSENPNRVRKNAIDNGWFTTEEIIDIAGK